MEVTTAVSFQIGRLKRRGWITKEAGNMILGVSSKSPALHIIVRGENRAVVGAPGIEAAFDGEAGLREAVDYALKL